MAAFARSGFCGVDPVKEGCPRLFLPCLIRVTADFCGREIKADAARPAAPKSRHDQRRPFGDEVALG
jgi:hypothetical protein